MLRRIGVVLVSLVTVVAPASAQLGGFGHQVDEDVDDLRFELESGGPDTVVVLDEDNNDRPSAGEQVFLSPNAGEIAAGSIRLANPAGGELGSRVESGDSISGTTATEVSGDLTFFDNDNDGDYERGEPIYWETDEGDTSELSLGDLRLNGDEAGNIVGSGNQNFGQGTTSLTGDFGYVDDDGDNSYSSGDRVFLDLRSDGWASIPDVRLSNQGSYAFGSMASVGQAEITHRLRTNGAPTNFVYIDADGDEQLDGDERIFVSDRTDQLFGDAIRLANPVNDEHGSFVGDGAGGEIGTDLTSLSGSLSYDDSNDNDELDPAEVVIFDRNAGTSGEADGNDLILSGDDAGRFVREIAPLNGRDLTDAPGSIAYVDDDANALYSQGDVVYLDADGDDTVSGNDLQFTNHEPIEQPDGDDDGVPDGEDNCPDTANPDQTDSDGDGTGDACEDSDGDGVADPEDNCPNTANPDQEDSDGDGTGDACDDTPQGGNQTADDTDGDGVPDEQDDCPNLAGPEANDGCPEDEVSDADDDGIPDPEDNCPRTANADQTDTDGDGVGDACDGDIDGDGLTNVRERGLGTDPTVADTDGDGVPDGEDNCPTTENPDQTDSDGDGIGDACADGAGQNGSPGPGLVALLASLAVAAGVLRRR